MDVTQLLSFLGGLALLVVGAELLVRGASRLAVSFGISPLVVGLTVVAFGTSSPEFAVSLGSALGGDADIALGNVIGSNIFNVLFILGVSALIVPLVVKSQLVRFDVPVMVGASVLLVVLCLDGRLGRFDGIVLFGLLIVYLVVLVRKSRRETTEGTADFEAEYSETRPGSLVNGVLILVGLGMLVVGSNLLLDAAVAFAEQLGVSDLVIGLTLVAAGTSLPEVATSVLAAVRGERDIAVGNVVGSNVFNILGVLGASAVAAPDGVQVAEGAIVFDLPVMLAVIVACLPIFLTGHLIARWEGTVFVGYYVAYTAYLILAATEHDALSPFSRVMLWFVIPLTIVTIVTSVVQARRSPA
ncbi:MAG TPA: calcium/sodium antiporter [Acidimicrobiia bacterium]|nr:calcium/sodium antiporter [Acidimicrobiia bacterium]